jgi:hypothetical protein
MRCGHGINSIEASAFWVTFEPLTLHFTSVPIEQECYYSYRQLQTPIATTKYCAGGGQYDCTDSTAQISRYSVASMLKLPKHKVEVTGEMSEPPPLSMASGALTVCDYMQIKASSRNKNKLGLFSFTAHGAVARRDQELSC